MTLNQKSQLNLKKSLNQLRPLKRNKVKNSMRKSLKRKKKRRLLNRKMEMMLKRKKKKKR